MSFALCPDCERPIHVADLRLLKNQTGKVYRSKKCKDCQRFMGKGRRDRRHLTNIERIYDELTEEGRFTVIQLKPGAGFLRSIKDMDAEELKKEEEEEKVCPCCGGGGPVSKIFGFRRQGKAKKQIAQSYCKKCRSGFCKGETKQ